MRLALATGLIVVPALVLGWRGWPGPARCAADLHFRSSGSVGSQGIEGPAVLRFVGSRDGDLTAGSPFELGSSSPTRARRQPIVQHAVRAELRDPVDRRGGHAGGPDRRPPRLAGRDDSGRRRLGVRVVMKELAPLEGSTLPPSLVPPFRSGGLSAILAAAPGGPRRARLGRLARPPVGPPADLAPLAPAPAGSPVLLATVGGEVPARGALRGRRRV